MRIGNHNTDEDVLVIAEIGNNHEGSYALAEELIGLAKDAGAGAVKFQTFITEKFISNADPDRFKRLKGFELSQAQFERLAAHAGKAGIPFISTPLDMESARFLRPLVAAFKIASSDNNFYPLLEEVAASDKPIILSTGLIDIEQIEHSASRVRDFRSRQGRPADLAVLHCVTSYPVPPEEANLAALGEIRKRLPYTAGYSDHTMGIEAAVLSVALGARIIEKHFTIDKNHSGFRDHQLSADPPEMARLVQRVREAGILLGKGAKVPQPGEVKIEAAVRRSIVAGRDLAAGKPLRWDDLGWTRPGGGLAPGHENAILGRILKRAVSMGERLSPDLFLD